MKDATMEEQADYSAWSHEKLIEHVTLLEAALKAKNESLTPSSPTPKNKLKKPRAAREFDPAKHSTRFVAFKLAYLGKRYNGFEWHSGNPTPLPTIEEELWKALNKARLIFPTSKDGKGTNPIAPGEINWEGCEYSKCGRTDKGVSAFGQVIGLRVRSSRPVKVAREEVTSGQEVEDHELSNGVARHHISDETLASSSLLTAELDPTQVLEMDESDAHPEDTFDPINDELPYCSLLNRLLPPDIRILAWCPNPPPSFSARFSCRERRYRYFFTQPAFAPMPRHLEIGDEKTVKDGWLDIDAMREAARLYEGEHDFRNFCKVDGGKQISNFARTIFKSDIEEVTDSTGPLSFINGESFLPTNSTEPNNPKIYTFTLHGSAFLWHQVRCMIAILFLVGQGLESPSIITELLDVKTNPCRPTYEMASDTPLVLWDCVFPEVEDNDRHTDAVEWIYVGDGPGQGDIKYGTASLTENIWEVWRSHKIDEILSSTLLSVVANQGQKVEDLSLKPLRKVTRSQRVFDGGNTPRLQGKYVPLMRKPKMESVEEINEKYAVRKGFESSADMKVQGFRRLNLVGVDGDLDGDDVADGVDAGGVDGDSDGNVPIVAAGRRA